MILVFANAHASTPSLLFKCPVAIKESSFFASVFQIETGRLYKLSSVNTHALKKEHSFVLPKECTGECVVTIDENYKTTGSEHYSLIIHNDRVHEINVEGNGSTFQVDFCRSLAERIKSGRVELCVFRIVQGSVDRFYSEGIDLTSDMSDSAFLYLFGVVEGDYLISAHDLELNLPLYQRTVHVSRENITPSALWMDISQRGEFKKGLHFTMADKDRWNGFVGLVPLKRRKWWTELIVVKKDGTTVIIDE
ncbi:MAG TPA: hypothetical protein DDZ88_18070 [Verrucomicrobiales bacterium]|nr:hypothetical protein [Verrucomicrobiales bacterium]